MPRLEDMVDMSRWKGTNYHWETATFAKSRKFGKDLPMSAGVAGLTKLVTLPLDRVVMAIHVHQLSPDKKLNALEFLYNPQRGGLGAILRPGVGATFGRYIATQCIAFTANENLQIRWLRPVVDSPHSTEYAVRSVWAGALAGTISQLITHPLDMGRVGFIPDLAKHRIYSSVKNLLERHYIEHGYKGLYRALGCSILGTTVYRGIYFGGFNVIRERKHGSKSTTFLDSWLIAQAVSTTAGLAVHPIEAVRRRLIYQFHPHNLTHYWHAWDCLQQVVKFRGVLALFRGLHVTLIRSVGAAVMLALFDRFKYRLK